MDGWFPRYSPSGHLCSRGAVDVSLSNGKIIPNAISTAWVDDETLLLRQHNGRELFTYNVKNDARNVVGYDCTHADASNGRFVYIAFGPIAIASDGRKWEGFGGGNSGCAICPDGTIGLLKHDGSVWIVPPGGVSPKFVYGNGTDIRACRGCIVWNDNGKTVAYDVYNWRVMEHLSIDNPEFRPIPFIHNYSINIMNFSQTRAYFRPMGSTFGNVLSESITMYPDITSVEGLIKFAWCDEKGNPGESVFYPPPPIQLVPPIEQPPIISPEGTIIKNIWSFLVGKENKSWVRTGNGGDMHLNLKGESAFFIKFSNPNTWERWALQDGEIYHVEDHSGHAGGNAESYQFSNGLWLSNEMAVGESLYLLDNHIRWFRDGKWTEWKPFPYKMTLKRHRTFADGNEDILFIYDPGTETDTYEVYRASLKNGWEAWAEVDQRTNTINNSTSWTEPASAKLLEPKNIRVIWPDERPIIMEDHNDPVEFPPRDETLDFYNNLEEYYQKVLLRPTRPTYVDAEGTAVWLQQYLLYRVNGLSHTEAMQKVKNDIDNA